MFRFANAYYLYLLFLLPVFAAAFYLVLRLRKKALKKLGDDHLVSQLIPEYSPVKPVLKFTILMLVFVCMVLGIARPQFGSRLVKMKRKGIEMVIALDVSNSMNAEDIQPSRLERAKQAISRLVERLDNDRIGLIVFAGDAYTQIPITSDYVSAKMFLGTIHSDIVPVPGTNIAKAITTASNSFTPETTLKRVIVVITDGENHEEDAVEAAKTAAGKGITVYTIGIGSPDGTPIPVKAGSSDFLKDNEGNVVVSKLNETILADVARAGGGIYVRANNTQFGLNTVLDELDSLEKKEYEANIYAEYNELFQYFFFMAFVLLLIDIFIFEKKSKWVSRLNLFDVKMKDL